MDRLPNNEKIISRDTTTIPLDELINEKIGRIMDEKQLLRDPDIGMMINYCNYPPGFITPWHYHDCAHGIYVLDGTLYTNEGSYSPGAFVWFPEGGVAEHGAITETGVTILFITNIFFLDKRPKH